MQLPRLLFGVQFPRGLQHRRFRVDADDAADIRRKAECEKPWTEYGLIAPDVVPDQRMRIAP